MFRRLSSRCRGVLRSIWLRSFDNRLCQKDAGVFRSLGHTSWGEGTERLSTRDALESSEVFVRSRIRLTRTADQVQCLLTAPRARETKLKPGRANLRSLPWEKRILLEYRLEHAYSLTVRTVFRSPTDQTIIFFIIVLWLSVPEMVKECGNDLRNPKEMTKPNVVLERCFSTSERWCETAFL